MFLFLLGYTSRYNVQRPHNVWLPESTIRCYKGSETTGCADVEHYNEMYNLTKRETLCPPGYDRCYKQTTQVPFNFQNPNCETITYGCGTKHSCDGTPLCAYCSEDLCNNSVKTWISIVSVVVLVLITLWHT